MRYIDTERIPIQIISKIENYSEEKIKKIDFLSNINCILFSDKIYTTQKIRFIHAYYQSLINNHTISNSLKCKIFLNTLTEITCFKNVSSDEIKSELNIRLVLDAVFENDDELSEKLLKLLFSSLYSFNLHQNGYYYNLLLSNIIALLYFYIYIDYSLLDDSRKKSLINLCKMGFKNNSYLSVDLNQLFYSHQQQMFDIILEGEYNDLLLISREKFGDAALLDAVGFHYFNTEKVFPLWFLFSALYDGKNRNENEYIFFEKAIKNKPERVYYDCTKLLACFTPEKKLSVENVKNIRQLNALVGAINFIDDEKQLLYFNYFNKTIQQLNHIFIDKNIDINEIVRKISQREFFNGIFYDSEIKSCTNNLKNISFISSINIKDFVGPITEDVFLGKNIEDNLLNKMYADLKACLTTVFNEEFKKILPHETFSANIEGVNKYINFLINNHYKYKTFDFYEIIIKNKIEISDDLFKSLVSIEQNISDISIKSNSLLLLNDNYVHISFKIIDIIFSDLTKEQIEDILNKKKILIDSFKIDNCYYDYKSAYSYIKESRKSISVTIAYETNITNKSGVICLIKE